MLKWLILLFQIFNVVLCYGQEEDLVFKHITEKNDLNNNIVNCIYRSPNGKMWIASYNGFNSYDGANFTAHKMRKGQNTMPNEVVHEVCEDKNGILWGATNNGIFSYNPANDSYRNYKLKSANNSLNFFNILCDKNGTIWTTGTWSLFKYNATKDTFIEQLILHNPLDTSKLCFVAKNGILEEASANKLWITTDCGLWYYDYKNNKMGNSITEKSNKLFAVRNTSALCEANKGGFWFFDNNTKSIVQFDPVLKKEIQTIPLAKKIPDAVGATLFHDRNNRLWFSSWNYDIAIVDLSQNNTIKVVFHKPEDARSIAGNFFWSAYQDPNNTVWLGTVNGISKCNTQNAIYKEFRTSTIIKEQAGRPIFIIEQDPIDNSYWLLCNDGILYQFDKTKPNTYKKIVLPHAPRNKKGLALDGVQSLKFIGKEIIVCCKTGIWTVEKSSGNMKPFSDLPSDHQNFAPTEIIWDGDSIMYFNNGKQLLYWNKLKSITQVYSLPNEKSSMYKMCATLSHQIWLMSSDKKLISLQNGKLNEINLNRDFELESGLFWNLLSDSANNLWIHSRGTGLYYYNTHTHQIKLYDMTDGLPANRMHEIVLDKKGRLWAMFYEKVSVFLPESKSFYNFNIQYKTDDLGYDNHLTRLNNGNLLATISDEMVEFFPERLLAKPKLSKPIISELNVKDKTFYTFDNTTIQLGTHENTLRIAFGSLIDNDLYPYDLEYRLNGKSDSWVNTEGNTEIIFTNLTPGKYELQVRAKGKNDAWVSETSIVRFIIKTPFYKTAWFLLALFSLVTIALYNLYKFRLNQNNKVLLLQNKAQLLEKEKAMVMYENLKEHLNPHFLFNSLTSLRSLIRIDQNMAGDFLDKMSKVYRYILKNRDNEVVALAEELKFVQMYIDLQKTRFEGGLNVEINIPDDYLDRKIAPVTLQNLVENAIKHNTANNESPLKIGLFIEDDYLFVQNNLQKKGFVETSNKQGLANMESLYKYLSINEMTISETEYYFTVKIPLL